MNLKIGIVGSHMPIKLLIITSLIVIFFIPFVVRPETFSGDEPHYVIALQSILIDYDLNLTNNYAIEYDAFNPSHHTVYVKSHSLPVSWADSFGGLDKGLYKERPIHPISFILLYAVLIAPLVSLLGVEKSALVVSHVIALGAAFVYYTMAKKYLSTTIALFSTIFLVFGTSFWFYANTVYPEMMLMLLLLVAMYLFLEKKQFVVIGACCALAASIKLPYVILIAVFGGLLALSKRARSLTQFGVGVLVIFVAYGAINTRVYYDPLFLSVIGNPFYPILSIANRYPITGIMGLLFHFTTGLLIFTPVLLFSFVQMVHAVRHRRMKLFVIIAIFIMGIYSLWPSWDGGYSFSYRLILPITPFLVLLAFDYIYKEKREFIRLIFFVLVFYSLAIQATSVMLPPELVTYEPPYLLQLLNKIVYKI